MRSKTIMRRRFSIILTLLVLASTLTVTAAGAQTGSVMCGTARATIVGTNGNDVLNGTPWPDVIAGLGGNDIIRGRQGNDIICGGAGADLIRGDNGVDVLMGGVGPDEIYGGNGNDEISGGPGNDRLFGANGADDISGDSGLDWIFGGNGADVISGGAGHDQIRGHSGRNVIDGDGCDDTLWGGPVGDRLSGGNGNDFIRGFRGNDILLGGLGDDFLGGGLNEDQCFDLVARMGGCEVEGTTAPASALARIESVWFAQTHVQRTTNANFRLVGNRPVVLKVDVVAPEGQVPASEVTATIRNGANSTQLTLSGPATLPRALSSAPGVVQHRYNNSFTVTIPARWVKPGLTVEVRAGDSVRQESPTVGAPSVLPMTMFDLHFFAQTTGNYPAGWEDELEAKLPVSDLDLTRVPNIVLESIVIPHRAGLPAVLVDSKEDYRAQTGQNFDGEQAAAAQLISALRRASGNRVTGLSLYYGNIYGVFAGGQAGGFGGVGNGNSVGILHHELGHAFGLPHWANNAAYPYRGNMYGIATPTSDVHVGPTWAFDLPSGTFIPPTVQPNNATGATVGTYKRDPMAGGGQGDQENGFLLRHFSDYSTSRIQQTLESTLDTYDPETKTFQTWRDDGYVDWGTGNGLVHPVDVDVDVVAIIASTSMADRSLNHVYEPFQYRGSRVRALDPTVAADRAAASGFCPRGGCDYSLRITQGGTTNTYMLATSGSDISDRMETASWGTAAINLPAANGAVTRVELLHTPNANDNGMPTNPTSLNVWTS